jgi:hypothetical protein
MSSITFKHGTKNEIDATEKVAGQILFSTDQTPNDKIYFDKDATTRIQIGGKDAVDTVLDANSNNPIANSGVAGVMLTTLNEVNAVTQSGTIVDSLALKQLASIVTNLQTTVNNYWKTVFPIGYIYMTTSSSFNPNTTFGGTWTRIKDRFLLADGNYYTNGDTGGEATHTLTINEMPKHRHNPMTLAYGEPSASPAGLNYGSASVGGKNFDWLAEVGGGQSHNNMPPYLVVRVWKRTA